MCTRLAASPPLSCKRAAPPLTVAHAPQDGGIRDSQSPQRFAPARISPLLTVERQSLSLILQCLPWRDKLLQLTGLCRALPSLHPADFRCDRLIVDDYWPCKLCPDDGHSSEWPQCRSHVRADVFDASPSLRRLLCQVRELRVWTRYDQQVAGRVLAVLRPPSLTAPSAFSRLRVLELWYWCSEDATLLFQRLIPSSAAFPALEHLEVDLQASHSQRDVWLDEQALLPLSRLPRLRSLRLIAGLTMDGFSLLCSLPLAQLGVLGRYGIDRAPRRLLPVYVAATWEVAELYYCRLSHSSSDSLAVRADVLLQPMIACVDHIAAAGNSAVACHPRLQRLLGGWDVGVSSMTAIARMPSLMELLHPNRDADDPWWDLSPLFTSDLQPLLLQLHTVEFPDADLQRLSGEALAVFLCSSAAFLTAYSSQLQVLTLVLYSSAIAGRFMESVLQCSQLRCLSLAYTMARMDQVLPERFEDVEQLDQDVLRLPPLRLLATLRLQRLYVTVHALSQFLSRCPALQMVTVSSVRKSLPDSIELEGGRIVEIQHGKIG